MDGFKSWLSQIESTANKRAAINPGIPAQAGLVFSKPPYGAEAFCKKIKQPGVRLDNMNTDNVCGKAGKVSSKDPSSDSLSKRNKEHRSDKKK